MEERETAGEARAEGGLPPAEEQTSAEAAAPDAVAV